MLRVVTRKRKREKQSQRIPFTALSDMPFHKAQSTISHQKGETDKKAGWAGKQARSLARCAKD